LNAKKISISKIEEHDPSGKVVQSVDVSTLNLDLISSDTENGSQYMYPKKIQYVFMFKSD
jgi:hypothetical protein